MSTPKTWADVASDLVSYVPAVFCLILITNRWDGEWLVVGALAAGSAGKNLVQNWLSAKRL